ncbi:hypothetical protein [Chitinophaga barathri]|uniref:Uncharacterized protein n=1 Tax=Chitinophaga barathri TaxID=1647451 RepID=A0A3N4M793_9BACT|nr:hypothetical protein [Chitinophaga barathri]RPD39098.1 hypothetical protein EG028_21010 [Chitinophaga barathri]
MSFLFGFFRFLTWGNIVVVGFFLLFVVMSLLLAPSPLEVLMTLLLLGSVMYHNILCTQLQRTLDRPEVPLPKSLPRTILFTGIVAFVYALLVTVNLILMGRVTDAEFMKMVNQNRMQGGEGVTAEMISVVRRLVFILAGIHAFAIAANCELSRIFFNKWRKEQQNKEDDTFLDINS